MLAGSVVDHLAAQGSLDFDQTKNLLFAVNAGSNTISVFSVSGDQPPGAVCSSVPSGKIPIGDLGVK
jgi:hypothetical protein